MNRVAPSKWIAEKQGSNLCEAWRFCEDQGFPLNIAGTVHFALDGMGGNYQDKRKKLMELMRKHSLRPKGFPGATTYACIWVLENSKTGKDAHLHFAVHYPQEIGFLRAFLGPVLAGIDRRVLHLDPIRDDGWLRYMLKGCHPSLYDHFLIEEHHRETQGVIHGKRCGASRAIDSAARKAFNGIISGKKHKQPNASNANPQARRTAKSHLIDNDSQLVEDDYHTRDISNPDTAPGL